MKRFISSLLALALTLSSVGALPLWAGPNEAISEGNVAGINGVANATGNLNAPTQTAVNPNQVSAVTGINGSIRVVVTNPNGTVANASTVLGSQAGATQRGASSLTSEAATDGGSSQGAPAKASGITSIPASALAAPVQSQPTGVRAAVSRLIKAFTGASSNSDAAQTQMPSYAYGIIRTPHTNLSVRKNVKVDEKPRPSDEGAVKTNNFHLSPTDVNADGSAPIYLDADASEASIEAALTKLVDSNPTKYGASSADMAKINVIKMAAGTSNGSDSYIGIYRQWKTGKDADGTDYTLMVNGGGMTFHVKTLADGKPVVMGTAGRLYPNISADIMTPAYNDNQLQGFAENKLLGTPPGVGPIRLFAARSMAKAERALGVTQEKQPQFITRQIANVGGQFRAVNMYDATDLKGQSMVVAVDIKTGEAFTWDDRSMIQTGPPTAAGISGAAAGRGNTVDPSDAANDKGPVGPLPLAYANVYDEKGNVVATTGADGSFSIPSASDAEPAPMKLTVRLEGKYGKVSDDIGSDAPMVATIVAAPGQTVTLTINPSDTGNPVVDEQLDANVNTYAAVTKQIDYLVNVAGLTDPRIQAPLAGGMNTNKDDMPANAYYDPSNDSINLERRATVDASKKADGSQAIPQNIENTAKASIFQKMATHRAVELLSGATLPKSTVWSRFIQRVAAASPKAAQVFENTARLSIILHEITHRAVQMCSQVQLTAAQIADKGFRFVSHTMDAIMDGGLNEGIADAVSEAVRDPINAINDPHAAIVGQGFWESGLPDGQPNYIRNAALVTKYDPSETEPHAASEPFSQSIWEIRQGLKQRMGGEAGGTYAAMLMLRTTILAQPQDMPSALMHFLLADMQKDGTIPNEDLIRGAAEKRAIPMQASPKPPTTASAPTTPTTPPAA